MRAKKKTERKPGKQLFSFQPRMSGMVSLEAPGSAALAAQGRKRGPSVLQRLRKEEEAAARAAAAACTRPRKRCKIVAQAGGMASSSGMAMKTGMVAARAKLAASSSGIVAAQDRQAALVGTGKYRVAEKVAREAPIGSLATNEMTKRKNSTASPAEFKTNFRPEVLY